MNWVRLLAGIAFVTVLCAFQRPFRVYRSMEAYDNIQLPADWREKTEWVFARLMYPQHPYARFGRWTAAAGDWTDGGTSWTQDYPRADRHFAQALRRLTRVHVRSVEQPVNLEDGDDVFNWPWLCAGEMGDWKLTDDQARRLREYLLRGGFLMLDDFWGTRSGAGSREHALVFPRPADRGDGDVDAIFHTVYDLNDRYQIPGRVGPAARQHLSQRRRRGALARYLRRPRPRDGSDVVQLRYRRFLGVGGRSGAIRKSIRRWASASA